MILAADELESILAHAVRDYPHEACGVVVVREGERRVIACRNLQDDLHRRDPERHPRDARTAYYIDPLDLLRIGRLEGEGFSIAVIYHSHVDADAYFSETDKRNALIADEPAYPGVIYIVTAVVAGRAETTAAFRWDSDTCDFVKTGLLVAATTEDRRA